MARSTGRRPETVGRRVVSGGIWNAASQLLPMVAATALSVVAARFLGAADLGMQSLIAFAEASLTALLVNSVTEATIRTLSALTGAGDVLGLARLRRWSMAAHVAAAAVAAIVLVGVGLTRDEESLSWFIVAGSVLFNALTWALSAQIVPEAGWRPVAQRRLVAQLAGPLLGIVAVLAGFGIAGIFLANIVATAGLLWSLARLRPTSARVSWGEAPRQLGRLWAAFALFEVVNQVAAKRIEFFFLAAYSTSVEVAMYSITFMVVSAAAVAPLAVAAASMPAVAAAAGAGDMERATDRFAWALRMAALVSLPLTALLVGLGPMVVELVYGAEYQRAADLVPLASLAILVAPAGQLCVSYWVGIGRMKPVIVAGAVGGVLDLVIAFGLIPGHGAVGAVLANLGGQVTTAVVLVGVTLRSLGGVDLRLDRWLVTAAAAAAGALALHVAGGFVTGVVGVVVAGAAGSLVFTLIGTTVGLLRPDDAEQLVAALPDRLAPFIRAVTCR